MIVILRGCGGVSQCFAVSSSISSLYTGTPIAPRKLSPLYSYTLYTQYTRLLNRALVFNIHYKL